MDPELVNKAYTLNQIISLKLSGIVNRAGIVASASSDDTDLQLELAEILREQRLQAAILEKMR